MVEIHQSETSVTLLSATSKIWDQPVVTSPTESYNSSSTDDTSVGRGEETANVEIVRGPLEESPAGSQPDVLLPPEESVVVEKPYGWVIVIAVFGIHVIIDGFTYSFGVLYPKLLENFHGSSVTTTLVVSILTGVTYGCGPLVSFLSQRFGLRITAIFGAVLASAGCLLSLLAEEIWQLIFTYGILTGLGFGFMYLPAIVCVASWFDKRRALATSIAVCGAGFGMFTYGPLLDYLSEEYALEGTMLIIGGITLNGFVFSALLRPPAHTPVRTKRNRPCCTASIKKLLNLKELHHRIVKNVDWKLLQNWKFLIYCLSAFLGGISSYIPILFLDVRAEKELTIDSRSASFLFSILGIGSIVGRLSTGLCSIKEKLCVDELIFYSISCIIAGISTGLSVLSYNYAGLASYSVIYGYTGGAIVALQSLVLTEIVGVEKISHAFGFLLFIQSIAVFIGPPFGAWIVENTGDTYTICYIIVGIFMGLSGMTLLSIPISSFFLNRRMREVVFQTPSDKKQILRASI